MLRVKTGGRKKGTPNKGTTKASIKLNTRLSITERIAALKIDPLDIVLRFAAGDWAGLGYEKKTKTYYGKGGKPYEVDIIDPATRLKAAVEACQYLYAKKSPLSLSEADLKTLERAKAIEEMNEAQLETIVANAIQPEPVTA